MALTLADELIDILEPLAEENGLELVTVETSGSGRGQVVRVFLDRRGGIDIDAITVANEWISEALEAVERLRGSYTLEVSSPGIERVLRKRTDFERFAGRRVAVRAKEKIEGRTSFNGILRGVNGEDVVIDVDGTEYRVSFGSIERARLKYDSDSLTEGV